ncbi:MAG: hypothetical protein JNL67_13100 [Planctomycetaceae bacterium]|nr:hypothetical protein [Planctomycetaceae bacterium]
MKLLVSVVNEEQAETAAQMGVPWLDLKDPTRGPLGMAEPTVQRRVLQRLLAWPQIQRSVALGEVVDHPQDVPLPLPEPGFQLAKLGTSHLNRWTLATPNHSAGESDWWLRWQEWYTRLPANCQGVLVAYADARTCDGLSIAASLELAAKYRLPYLLIDTYDKSAGGLFAILQRERQLHQVSTWIQQAQSQGTHLALAGQLGRGEVQQLAEWGAEIVGVRSAVCQHNRDGQPRRSGALCRNRLRRLLEFVATVHER